MKLSYQICHPSKTILQFVISGIADIPKPSLKAPDSQYEIHNSVLYQVRPEVQ
jgi:hypothetical protein